MSNPIQINPVSFDQFQEIEGTDIVELKLFTPFGGIDQASPLAFVDPNHTVWTENMEWGPKGFMFAANDAQGLTTSTSGTKLIISMFMYQIGEARYYVAITESNVQIRTDGATYTVCTGPAFTGLNIGDRFSFVPFGNLLLFTNPVVGMHALDLVNRTYTYVSAAPVAPFHVTQFNGRVFVTRPVHVPQRCAWSVKFNYLDWTGLGSGFEDLQPLSSASGTNYPYSLWPFSDTQALLARSGSTDLVSSTDSFDAPFRFQYLHQFLGTAAPNAVARTPYGLIIPTYDEIYLLPWNGEPQRIATPHWGLALQDEFNTNLMYSWVGAYVKWYDEYWLWPGSTELSQSESSNKIVLRYNFRYQGWTVLKLAQVPSDIVDATGAFYSSYDSAVGITYDSLTGLMGDFGSNAYRRDVILPYSYVEAKGLPGTGMPNGLAFETGQIELASIDNKIDVTDVIIMYESTDSGPIAGKLEYSVEEQPWQTYGTMSIIGGYVVSGSRGAPSRTVALQRTVSGNSVRFRFSVAANVQIPYRFKIHQIKIRGHKSGPTMIS